MGFELTGKKGADILMGVWVTASALLEMRNWHQVGQAGGSQFSLPLLFPLVFPFAPGRHIFHPFSFTIASEAFSMLLICFLNKLYCGIILYSYLFPVCHLSHQPTFINAGFQVIVRKPFMVSFLHITNLYLHITNIFIWNIFWQVVWGLEYFKFLLI